jgi:hypothetical protein
MFITTSRQENAAGRLFLFIKRAAQAIFLPFNPLTRFSSCGNIAAQFNSP